MCNDGEYNSTTLEVQVSFGLTYMVGFIPLNLRSQEMDKSVPHARAPPPAGRGECWPTLGVTQRPFSFSFRLREVK
jgi:hypothetical protein